MNKRMLAFTIILIFLIGTLAFFIFKDSDVEIQTKRTTTGEDLGEQATTDEIRDKIEFAINNKLDSIP